jgi:hypothetical protein
MCLGKPTCRLPPAECVSASGQQPANCQRISISLNWARELVLGHVRMDAEARLLLFDVVKCTSPKQLSGGLPILAWTIAVYPSTVCCLTVRQCWSALQASAQFFFLLFGLALVPCLVPVGTDVMTEHHGFESELGEQRCRIICRGLRA